MLGIACKQNNPHHHDSHGDNLQGNSLQEEILKIHDELMPKMGKIFSLKEALQKKLDETPDLTEEKKEEIKTAIHNLEKADQAMRDWMHSDNPPADSLGEEGIQKYLEEQKKEILKVKDDMLKALEMASKLNS